MTTSTAPRWQAAADPTRRIGCAVDAHDELPSTNDRARALLDTPGGEGIAVVAELQTAGRGRRGRSWLSPAGRNLTCSIAVRPRVGAARAGLLGLAAALAVREACRPWAELAIRWPNDLVTAGDRKVAGILVETTLDGERVASAVIGIGINVNWRQAEMPAELAATATSLADVVDRAVPRVELLGRLLTALDHELTALEAGGTPVARALRASALAGRRVKVDLGNGRISGTVTGLDDDGSLVVTTDRGRVSLSHGEVVRVEPADGGTRS
jgi:BirA family transcriptional regulator, biotin operon repressor / biotin---[acetyl-CoA-carboxylase] ligase